MRTKERWKETSKSSSRQPQGEETAWELINQQLPNMLGTMTTQYCGMISGSWKWQTAAHFILESTSISQSQINCWTEAKVLPFQDAEQQSRAIPTKHQAEEIAPLHYSYIYALFFWWTLQFGRRNLGNWRNLLKISWLELAKLDKSQSTLLGYAHAISLL